MSSENIISQLADAIGSDALITDFSEREYFSMDVFDIDQVADLVFQPRSKNEISIALKIYQKQIIRLYPEGEGCPTQAVTLLQQKDLSLLTHHC